MSVPSPPVGNSWPVCSDGQIRFYWEPPTSDGGSPITQYTLACSSIAYTQDISANINDFTVTGLTNQTNLTFTLTASNTNGTGPAATYPTVQTGLSPYGPASATVSTLNASTALVSWTPSSIVGETALTAYLVQCFPSTPAISSFSATQDPFKSSITITGLSTNHYYQFLVRGVNSIGYSPPSIYTDTLAFGIYQIATSGLVVRFDATNYSGSGAWSNLGSLGSNYNATIENGTPSLNAASNGVVFNGATNFLFSNPAVGNAWSAAMWVKRTGASGVGGCYLTQQFNGTSLNAAIFTDFVTAGPNNASATQAAGGFFTGAAWRNTAATDLTLSNWVHLTYSWNGTTLVSYSNGVPYASNVPGVAAVDSGLSYRMGRRWDPSTLPNYIEGEIGQLLFYNRGITAQEAAGNYDATAPTFAV